MPEGTERVLQFMRVFPVALWIILSIDLANERTTTPGTKVVVAQPGIHAQGRSGDIKRQDGLATAYPRAWNGEQVIQTGGQPISRL